jgi:hypothetical protein
VVELVMDAHHRAPAEQHRPIAHLVMENSHMATCAGPCIRLLTSGTEGGGNRRGTAVKVHTFVP